MSKLVREFTHGFKVWHVQVLDGGADGAGRRGVLAARGSRRVEEGPEREVENDIVLVGTNDAK